MPRIRRPIEAQVKNNLYFAKVKHPVLKRTVHVNFGDRSQVEENLKAFNTIFMNPALWHNPPATTPDSILTQWNGHGNAVKLRGGVPSKGGKPLSTTADEVSRLQTALDAAHVEIERLLRTIEKKDAELEHWRGKKTIKGPSPSLETARKNFMEAYRSGALSRKPGQIPDADAIKNIEWDLIRFCNKFGDTTPANKFDDDDGAKLLSNWIHGLKNAKGELLSATRRMQIRVYVLKMLEYVGVHPSRKLVARPDTKSKTVINDTTQKGNGVINYLTRDEAAKVAEKLPQPWADLFRLQCTLGLRPDECITLHKNNFSPDLSKLDLAPLQFEDRFGAKITLTLKTGPRAMPVPENVRSIVGARLKRNAVLFPDGDGYAWNDPKKFNRRFKAALVKAARKAHVKKPMDSRIGRRSCASWLMQDDVSAEKVAKLMGNSPEMIREHYGDPDVMSMDLGKMLTDE